MDDVLKKGIVLVIAAFCLYYLLTAPAGAASVVSDAGGAVLDGFSQLGVFVNELLG